MNAGWLTAVEVLEEMDRNKDPGFITCLAAMRDAEQGQAVREKDPQAAITLLHRAYTALMTTPAATRLQGICAADLAAAHAQLGKFDEAAKYARESIARVSGIRRLAGTEGVATMTLGICLHHAGDDAGARSSFHLARQLFSTLPDRERLLSIVDHNEKALAANRRRWWRFWGN
jgi:hypothetical protein